MQQLLPGTYGSTASTATHKSDVYFSGEGVLILPGATTLGDFNGDNKVDAADYVVWRKTMPTDFAKYDEWRSNFGNPSGSGSSQSLSSGSSVPEPSTTLVAGLAACLLQVVRAGRPKCLRRC
jgi:hypothetical protein